MTRHHLDIYLNLDYLALHLKAGKQSQPQYQDVVAPVELEGSSRSKRQLDENLLGGSLRCCRHFVTADCTLS